VAVAVFARFVMGSQYHPKHQVRQVPNARCARVPLGPSGPRPRRSTARRPTCRPRDSAAGWQRVALRPDRRDRGASRNRRRHRRQLHRRSSIDGRDNPHLKRCPKRGSHRQHRPARGWCGRSRKSGSLDRPHAAGSNSLRSRPAVPTVCRSQQMGALQESLRLVGNGSVVQAHGQKMRRFIRTKYITHPQIDKIYTILTYTPLNLV